MPANLFAAIRPCEVTSEVGANHAGEFIRRYSPVGSDVANERLCALCVRCAR